MAKSLQVVMRQDVQHVGKIGQAVRVRPGFARNYLLPRGLAMVATKASLAQVAQIQAAAEAKASKVRAEQERLIASLSSLRLEITKPAGDNGKLFGSVTSQEISAMAAAQGYDVDRKLMRLPEDGIKSVGEHQVLVELSSDLQASFTVVVEAA